MIMFEILFGPRMKSRWYMCKVGNDYGYVDII